MDHRVLSNKIEKDKEEEKEIIEMNFEKIQKRKVNRRWRVVAICAISMIILSVYFLSSFFLSYSLYS